MAKLIMRTDLALPGRRQGKVRDLYDVTLPGGEQALLIVATDRVSAFDVVLANGPAGKGVVLTQISKFWFERFGGEFKHHLLSTEAADVPALSAAERAQIAGRMMLCRKTRVLPVECIARGYLAGSGWKDYQRTGQVCGIDLPPGLANGSQLPEPLFTPSTMPTPATTRTSASSKARPSSARTPWRGCATPRCACTGAPATTPSRRASCWRTPSSSSA